MHRRQRFAWLAYAFGLALASSPAPASDVPRPQLALVGAAATEAEAVPVFIDLSAPCAVMAPAAALMDELEDGGDNPPCQNECMRCHNTDCDWSCSGMHHTCQDFPNGCAAWGGCKPS